MRVRPKKQLHTIQSLFFSTNPRNLREPKVPLVVRRCSGMRSCKSCSNTRERAGESSQSYTDETKEVTLAKWKENVAFPPSATFLAKIDSQFYFEVNVYAKTFPSQGTSSKWLKRQPKEKNYGKIKATGLSTKNSKSCSGSCLSR